MNSSREAIMQSIRSHLAASAPHDARERALAHPAVVSGGALETSAVSLVELFRQNVQAVDGHCVIARGEVEIAAALTRIIRDLQQTEFRGRRIAISDSPAVERLLNAADLEIEELAIAPAAKDLFNFDIGVTTAQAGIAETGTLVLDAAFEKHRLVSLVPPVHIAIVDAARIYLTLGEILSGLQSSAELSPAITFITGPSRTADIELTLAIGVHGPRELYVIVAE